MQVYNVIIRPLLSEKSNDTKESLSKYSFVVDIAASKKDVALAVDKLFGVKALRVNTCTKRIRPRRKGMTISKARLEKKAIVTLAKGEKIKQLEFE